jgi:CO/xanthine dehydrogenase Mo-binding subunit
MAKRGQPQFQPTDRQRGQVEAMARYGIPEGGITPGLAVVANAILDALAPPGPLGVEQIDMPATPERVWRAIRKAQETAR